MPKPGILHMPFAARKRKLFSVERAPSVNGSGSEELGKQVSGIAQDDAVVTLAYERSELTVTADYPAFILLLQNFR